MTTTQRIENLFKQARRKTGRGSYFSMYEDIDGTVLFTFITNWFTHNSKSKSFSSFEAIETHINNLPEKNELLFLSFDAIRRELEAA